tara:strand:+ start:108 stop:470 length:363 start_codon:yes stop_codon:yes gene_type:complete
MAQYEEITIDQGSDATIQLELVDANGSKKNLSNYTIIGKVKKNFTDSSGEATAFTTGILNPATDGVCTIKLSNAQTRALKAGRYVYDVELKHTDSSATTINERVLEGIITVTPSVVDSAV